MRDITFCFKGMSEKSFRALYSAFLRDDILNVCRVMYKHLYADTLRKEKRVFMGGKVSTQSMEHKSTLDKITTVGDLEELWK